MGGAVAYSDTLDRCGVDGTRRVRDAEGVMVGDMAVAVAVAGRRGGSTAMNKTVSLDASLCLSRV